MRKGRYEVKANFILLLGFLLAAILILYKSGDFALMDPDEARYAEASREMMEQDSYIVPLFNYEPRLNKPILFYWIQIASFYLFGVNEFAARLPSALAGLGAMIVVFLLGRLLFDINVGLLSFFIFFTNLFFFAFSRAATLETLLLLTFSASIYFFLKADMGLQKREGSKRSLYISLFFITMGLSFLIKGPVGVLVPVFMIALYLIIMKRLSPFTFRNIISGITLFLTIIVPWGWALISKEGFMSIMKLLEKETMERYFIGFDHPEPFYYYLPIFLAGFFPWSSFIPGAIWQMGKDHFKRRRKEKLFLLIWLFFPLLFFSLSGSKLPGYILPVLPAAALIVASEWFDAKRYADHNECQAEILNTDMTHTEGQKRYADHKESMEKGVLFKSGYILLALFISLFLIYGFFMLKRFPEFKAFYFSTSFMSLFLLVMGLISLIKKKPPFLFSFISLFSIVLLIFFIVFFLPQLQSMRSAKRLVLSTLFDRSDGIIATYQHRIPSLNFYSKRKIMVIEGEKDLRSLLKEGKKIWIVVSEKNYKNLSASLKEELAIEGKVDRFFILKPSGRVPP